MKINYLSNIKGQVVEPSGLNYNLVLQQFIVVFAPLAKYAKLMLIPAIAIDNNNKC